MLKIERVYRQILKELIEEERKFFQQKELAKKCFVSLGLVNYSLKPLVKMGAIMKTTRGFRVIDPTKILMHWASIRDLEGDIILQTGGPDEAELEMPPGILFTAYSAAKIYYGIDVANYSEIWVYSNPEPIAKRFSRGPAKIIVLKPDKHLFSLKKTPIAQIFVDLWNIPTWYAREFMLAVRERIDGVLARLGY